MLFRLLPTALLSALSVVIAGCDGNGAGVPGDGADGAISADPVVARALNDPLMTDPDLSWRSEANAVLGFDDVAALPVIVGSPGEADRVRELSRRQLLDGGPIADLPIARSEAGPGWPTNWSQPDNVLAALNAPDACRGVARSGFSWASTMPPVAAIMPQGMVQQASGASATGCNLRMVQYHSAAEAEDILAHHHTLALRAGLYPEFYAKPQAVILAKGSQGQQLLVWVRKATGSMHHVAVIHWSR